jgi:putative chitinase
VLDTLSEKDRLGNQLWALIEKLRATRGVDFHTGPAEALAAHRVLLAMAEPDVSIAGFRDQLAPVFAKTRDQRALFMRAIDEMAPPRPPPRPTTPERLSRTPPSTGWERLKRRATDAGDNIPTLLGTTRGRIGLVILMFLIAFAALSLRRGSAPKQVDASVAPSTAAQPTPTVDQPLASPGPQATSGKDPLSRLLRAAGRHGGAPTLAEIAHELAPDAPIVMKDTEYLRRLRDLTGLQPNRPLFLVSAQLSSQAFGSPASMREWRSQPSQTLVAWAIGLIEIPGQGPSYREIDADIRGLTDGQFAALKVVVGLNTPFVRDLIDPHDSTSDAIAKLRSASIKFRSDSPRRGAIPNVETASDSVVARAIAIVRPDWNPPDAPWRPQQLTARILPSWASWLLAALALAIFIPAILVAFDPRRAFLRRKPPLTAPHRARLLREVPPVLLGPPLHFAEIRKALQRREAQLTASLDIAATIQATVASGGRRIIPKFGMIRAAPEYLFLIERKGLNDLEAERVAALIAPLRTGVVGIDLFWFQSDPAWCTPESGGSAVRIEALVARFPNHRMLLMASGVEMIDLFRGQAKGGYIQLNHWFRRGMLTPVPAAEWAREERLIAREFKGPLGRSTSGGMMTLARGLLADLSSRGSSISPDGDDDAPPLPDSLRAQPQRFLAQDSPHRDEDGVDPVDDLLIDLGWYPDKGGFDWLCALAVYPALSFDLALYLGQTLPEKIGDTELDTPRLFTPRRLAALTQLPWLREGTMPDWLRRRLIALMPVARAAEVRQRILGLINDARFRNIEALPNRAMFGREPSQGLAAERLYSDEVLVEFLLTGQPEDFEIALPPPESSRTLRQRLRALDPLRIGTICLALAYALATWWATPGAGDGPPVTSLMLPVVAIFLAALTCLVMIRPVTAWMGARRMAHRLGPIGLVCAVFAAMALAAPLIERATGVQPRGPLAVTIIAMLCLGLLPVADQLSGRLNQNYPFATQKLGAGLLYLLRCMGVAILGFGLATIAAADDRYGRYYLVAIVVYGMVLFGLGLRPGPPEVRTDPDLARQRDHKPPRRAAPFIAGLVLLGLILIYASGLRRSQVVLAPPSNYQPFVATSDGLIAISQSDGITVKVFGIEFGGPLRGSFSFADKRFKTFAEINRLAVRTAGPPESDIVVASLSDGIIFVKKGSSLPSVLISRPDVVAGPTRIAISPVGDIAWAQIYRDGRTEIGIQYARRGKQRPLSANAAYLEPTGSSTMSMDVKGQDAPVMTIESIGNQIFAYSTADGAISTISSAGPETHSRPGALKGGAIMIRALTPVDSKTPAFLAVASDGTAVKGTVSANLKLKVERAGPFPTLATGPVVQWVEAKKVVNRNVKPPPPTKIKVAVDPSLKIRAQVLPPPLLSLATCNAQSKMGAAGQFEAGTGAGSTRGFPSRLPIAEVLDRFAPNQPNRAEIAQTISILAPRYDLDQPRAMAVYLANILHETGSLRVSSENLDYSENRIVQVWPARFSTIESAKPYAHQPECLANYVYANRLGNGDEASGDGARFRGRGLLMVAGRANYARYAEALGVDLLNSPDLLATSIDVAVRQSMTAWKDMGLNQNADKGDIVGVRRRLTGGTIGTPNVELLFNQILPVLSQFNKVTTN